jgi:hypothetical protein
MDQEIWREVAEFRVEDYFDVTALTFGPMFLPGASPNTLHLITFV